MALFAGLPAIIAAWSSLRNGREQARVRDELRDLNGSGSIEPKLQKTSLLTAPHDIAKLSDMRLSKSEKAVMARVLKRARAAKAKKARSKKRAQ